MSKQIALPLMPPDGGDPGNIVIGAANQRVVEALQEPKNWPYGTAILAGPARSGKSLLGSWFARTGRGEFIDDADALDETDLFHRWNMAREQDQKLLLAIRAQPWEIDLPDLRSRVSAGLALTIDAPDDAMAADLLASHAERRNLAIGPDAYRYIVPRIERSFAAIEQLATAIDRLTLERKCAPSLSVWREALARTESQAETGERPAN